MIRAVTCGSACYIRSGSGCLVCHTAVLPLPHAPAGSGWIYPTILPGFWIHRAGSVPLLVACAGSAATPACYALGSRSAPAIWFWFAHSAAHTAHTAHCVLRQVLPRFTRFWIATGSLRFTGYLVRACHLLPQPLPPAARFTATCGSAPSAVRSACGLVGFSVLLPTTGSRTRARFAATRMPHCALRLLVYGWRGYAACYWFCHCHWVAAAHALRATVLPLRFRVVVPSPACLHYLHTHSSPIPTFSWVLSFTTAYGSAYLAGSALPLPRYLRFTCHHGFAPLAFLHVPRACAPAAHYAHWFGSAVTCTTVLPASSTFLPRTARGATTYFDDVNRW